MLTVDQENAVWLIADAAVASQIASGIPALFTCAQCIYESKYLERSPGNNCFGIKRDAFASGGTQYVLTHEFLNGQWKEMPLAFETYASLSDCFADHARLLQSGVYLAAWQQYSASRRDIADLDTFISAVCVHYATDPAYTSEMLREAHSETVESAVLKAMLNAGMHRAPGALNV